MQNFCNASRLFVWQACAIKSFQNATDRRPKTTACCTPGRIALVAGSTKLKTYASSSPPPLWPPKREYNAVSAERSMKFGSTVRVETLQHSTKTTALRRKADRGVRYDCYLQLVASKRIERVPNLQPAKGGGRSWSCKWSHMHWLPKSALHSTSHFFSRYLSF